MAPTESTASNQTQWSAGSSLTLDAWLSAMLKRNNTLLVLSPLADQAALRQPHTLPAGAVKPGYEAADSGQLARLSDGRGAVFYITIVILFYGLSVVMIIVSRINKNRFKQLEDRQIHKYLQEFQTVKERSRQDSYRHLKRSVIARLGLARLPKTSSTTLGQALVPAVALALPRSNLCQLRASPFFDRSLTASQRSSLVPDDFRILPATTAASKQRQSLASSCDDQRSARNRPGTARPSLTSSDGVSVYKPTSAGPSPYLDDRPQHDQQQRIESNMELLSEKDELDFMDDNMYEDEVEEYYTQYQDDDNNGAVHVVARSHVYQQSTRGKLHYKSSVGTSAHVKNRPTSKSDTRSKNSSATVTHIPQISHTSTTGASRPNRLPLLTITSSSDTPVDSLDMYSGQPGHSGLSNQSGSRKQAAGEMNEAYVTMDTPAASAGAVNDAGDSRNGYRHHHNYLDVPLNVLPELSFSDSVAGSRSNTELAGVSASRRGQQRHSKRPTPAPIVLEAKLASSAS